MILHKMFTERLWKVVFTYQVTALKKYMNCWREFSWIDHVDFNKELDTVTSTEEIHDKKKVFKCIMCGKEYFSS